MSDSGQDFEEYKYICDCSVLDNKGKVLEAHKRQDHTFVGGCRIRLGTPTFCGCSRYSQKKQILNPDYKGD